MSVDDMSRRAVDSGYIDGDSPAARFIYGRISYQHISEYFPLLDESTTDLPHTIQSIHRLMSFDRSFQALLLKYTGLIELQLRSRYSKEMSTRFGAFADRNAKLYVDSNHFDDYLKRYSDWSKMPSNARVPNRRAISSDTETCRYGKQLKRCPSEWSRSYIR